MKPVVGPGSGPWGPGVHTQEEARATLAVCPPAEWGAGQQVVGQARSPRLSAFQDREAEAQAPGRPVTCCQACWCPRHPGFCHRG